MARQDRPSQRAGWGIDQWSVALMLAPYLIGLFTLVLLPTLLTLTLAFTNFNALTPSRWVGFANFVQLFDDRIFGIALTNTLLYLVLAVPLRIGLAWLFAAWLTRPRRGIKIVRTAIYLPTVIPDLPYALIWLVLLNPSYGPINLILGGLGLPTPLWAGAPWPARISLLMLTTWQLGENFVLVAAAQANIPPMLYEASTLDGANPWARARYLTLPLLWPSLVLLTARDLLLCLQTNFVPTLVITKGGPGYATLLIPLYAYQRAFEDLHLGYAAAMVWTLYVITLLAVTIQWRSAYRWLQTDPIA